MSSHRLDVRPALPDDLDELTALEQRWGDVHWSRAQFSQELAGAQSRLRVLRLDGKLCGFGGYWRVADEAQVTNLVVTPEYRRLGFGMHLLSALLEEACREHCRRATLEVRATNEAACGLYRKLGFRQVGQRSRFYVNPVDDALLMEKSLEPTT